MRQIGTVRAMAERIELTRSAEKEAKAIADAEEAAAKAECASGRKTKMSWARSAGQSEPATA